MVYRLTAPDWLMVTKSNIKKVLEGEFTDEQIKIYNNMGYNIYFLPNYPKHYDSNTTVDGTHIDTFRFVFVDMDLKDKVYKDKDEFLHVLANSKVQPSFIVDSGNGIHAYYEVIDLDAHSFLRLQRRLCRFFKTDEAVSKIYQLMRVPNTINTKHLDAFKVCEILQTSDRIYSSEDLDILLPPICLEDEVYCTQHYNKTYSPNRESAEVDDRLPLKFGALLAENAEVKKIWTGGLEDRSRGDFRLAHIMLASGFTRDEAMSVLVNCAKALSRAPIHRIGYAENIVTKIWSYEQNDPKTSSMLSSSVRDILERPITTANGTRFPCWQHFDDTLHGFRLGQVIGLVAGSGVGKTAIALNMFEGFVNKNPDYTHFFIPLEQPAEEIAQRWKTMCGANTTLYDKVHVISNYGPNGEYRDLSLAEIKEYILKFQNDGNRKVGCVVIDHIGVLANNNKLGQDEGVKKLCKEMKAFAQTTNTMLVMQSQTNREKAGIGDLELNKDAAFGTSVFENFCDYVITIWQPLKRCYAEGAPTVTAFKFCKIRHKKQGKDKIMEDICYNMFFDPNTERLRELTQIEEKSFTFFLQKATNKRKQDRKADLVEYVSAKEGALDGRTDSDRRSTIPIDTNSLH